jgi:hypothetical protein
LLRLIFIKLSYFSLFDFISSFQRDECFNFSDIMNFKRLSFGNDPLANMYVFFYDAPKLPGNLLPWIPVAIVPMATGDMATKRSFHGHCGNVKL